MGCCVATGAYWPLIATHPCPFLESFAVCPFAPPSRVLLAARSSLHSLVVPMDSSDCLHFTAICRVPNKREVHSQLAMCIQGPQVPWWVYPIGLAVYDNGSHTRASAELQTRLKACTTLCTREIQLACSGCWASTCPLAGSLPQPGCMTTKHCFACRTPHTISTMVASFHLANQFGNNGFLPIQYLHKYHLAFYHLPLDTHGPGKVQWAAGTCMGYCHPCPKQPMHLCPTQQSTCNHKAPGNILAPIASFQLLASYQSNKCWSYWLLWFVDVANSICTNA